MHYKISYVFLFVLLSSTSSLKIQDCSNKTTIKTICKLVETYEMSLAPEPSPLLLDLDISILDIVDLDWTAKTMKLFIELWSFWKDPRITITDYSDEKEKGLILLHFESTKKALLHLTFIFLIFSFTIFMHHF